MDHVSGERSHSLLLLLILILQSAINIEKLTKKQVSVPNVYGYYVTF